MFASCAQALALAQGKKDDLVAILDPEHGFAPKLRQICREQYVFVFIFIYSLYCYFHREVLGS